MDAYYAVPDAARADALSHYRALPLRQQRALRETYAGIRWQDAHGIWHVMTWGVIDTEPRRRPSKHTPTPSR